MKRKKRKRRRARSGTESESKTDSKRRSTNERVDGTPAVQRTPASSGPSTVPEPAVPPSAVPEPAIPEPVIPEPAVPGGVQMDHPPHRQAPSARQANIPRALDGTDTTRGAVPDAVLDVLADGGKPLDGPIQRALEERLDADFSNVRIHTGAKAVEAADAIDAKAFTCGNDIVFNAGERDPEPPEGQFYRAHELAHTRHQIGAAVYPMPGSGAELQPF